MGDTKYTFPKAEKLTGKKRIEELFKRGSSFYLKDIGVRYKKPKDDDRYHRVLITVPKKNFKRAVDRNLLKRRIREAYRLNKDLIQKEGTSTFFHIGFIYLSKNILTFHVIQDQLIECLKRLEAKQVD
ncbi:MAG: ribonuclease P protein component [Ekhidna sp.]